jgi:hypothetical protein
MGFLSRGRKKEFDYAAIRIGNVYVLPPDEEDLREFRQRRRREVTRRGFLVAGAAAALGALALPFLPGKKRALDPKMLFELDPASADKRLLKDLCIAFFRHPSAEIRKQCAFAMAILPGDSQVREALWLLIRQDPQLEIRRAAVHSLIQHHDHAEIPAILDLYLRDATVQHAIEEAIEDTGFEELRQQILSSMTR